MKKIYMLLLAVLALSTAYGKTLRVNNTLGNGAPYTSVEAALDDANDGDVIIIEKSNQSYGDVTITKPVTLQGEGYFLDINQPGNEGTSSTSIGNIFVKSPEVKIYGMYTVQDINVYTNRVVISRCNVRGIVFRGDFNTGKIPCTDCIVHQNYIRAGVTSSSYPDNAHNIQITNNIFITTSIDAVSTVNNSIISRNTVFRNIGINSNNSVIENNINGVDKTNDTNSFKGNVKIDIDAKDFTSDKSLHAATQGFDAGAFSGDDPYVLSGIARGVRVIDLQMPESVEQGSDLQVTVKVATQR